MTFCTKYDCRNGEFFEECYNRNRLIFDKAVREGEETGIMRTRLWNQIDDLYGKDVYGNKLTHHNPQSKCIIQ